MKLRLYFAGASWAAITFALLCLAGLLCAPQAKPDEYAPYLWLAGLYSLMAGGTFGQTYAQCEGLLLEGHTTILRLFGLTALLLGVLWSLSVGIAFGLVIIGVPGPYETVLRLVGIGSGFVAVATPGIAAFLLHVIVADGYTRTEFGLAKKRESANRQAAPAKGRGRTEQPTVRQDAAPTGRGPQAARQQPERRD